MADSAVSFRDFELQGWSADAFATGYHDHFGPITRQSVGALLDAAAVGPGTRVLDVATGAGYAAAAAAERGARATGVDFSAAQIALAARHYPAVAFRECDAGALPFGDGGFDAVVSNFGMPHFPEPDAFLREAFRVLRRGGRLAFSVWAAPQESVGLGILFKAVQAHGRMDVALPPGPNFFLFSDPAHCERSLQGAGFRSASIVTVPQLWRGASPDGLFEAIMNGTVRTAAVLQAQTPQALAAIREAMRQDVAAYGREGTIELMIPAVIAAAEKP